MNAPLTTPRPADRIPVSMSWRSVWQQCPYRSLIGSDMGQRSIQEMMATVRATVAVIDGDPEPFNETMASDIAALLVDGGTVLLLSNRADLRDAAKGEINRLLKLAQAPAGGLA